MHEEEAVVGGALEARHREDGMVEPRQPQEHEQAMSSVAAPAQRIATISVAGTKAGQLCSGRPPTLSG